MNLPRAPLPATEREPSSVRRNREITGGASQDTHFFYNRRTGSTSHRRKRPSRIELNAIRWSGKKVPSRTSYRGSATCRLGPTQVRRSVKVAIGALDRGRIRVLAIRATALGAFVPCLNQNGSFSEQNGVISSRNLNARSTSLKGAQKLKFGRDSGRLPQSAACSASVP